MSLDFAQYIASKLLFALIHLCSSENFVNRLNGSLRVARHRVCSRRGEAASGLRAAVTQGRFIRRSCSPPSPVTVSGLYLQPDPLLRPRL